MKTLSLLYGLVAVLALGVILASKSQNKNSGSSAQYERGAQPFSAIEIEQVSSIEITDGERTTTLALDNDQWTVTERNDYPADVNKLRSVIQSLSSMSITQSLEAGPTYDSRFGIDTTVTLKDSSGAVLNTVQLGKEIGNESQDLNASLLGGNTAKGRYLRFHEDEAQIYAVNTPISGTSTNPKNWLLKDFIAVNDLTSISLSKPGDLETTEWKLTRQTPAAKLNLVGEIPLGMEADSSGISNLETQFGYAQFEDILSPEAGQGLSDSLQTQRARIETAEGFSYTVDISPKTIQGTENKILTIKVEGNFAEKRTRPSAETVEEGDSADELHAKELADKKERLAQQKALEGTYFEVSPYVVENLLKTRAELLQPAAQDSTAPPLAPIPFR